VEFSVMTSLSLVVIARNEEDCIARCLRSASFADQMIVVANASTDRTVEIARELGATVVETEDWPGFGPQKNRALDAATGEWVLSLDADEWLEPATADEIRRAVARPGDRRGFNIPRRSRFCGQIVRHGGWSPDLVLRLFRRDAGRFSDDLVHERVIVQGPLGRLSAPIEHDSVVDLDDAHDKIGRYAEIAARQIVESGASSSAWKALTRSGWAFTYSYFIRCGFADGLVGAMVAAYQASYTYQKWARAAIMLRRLRESARQGKDGSSVIQEGGRARD
jgi:glycosyltransferase involved in cell wall biosynthesis